MPSVFLKACCICSFIFLMGCTAPAQSHDLPATKAHTSTQNLSSVTPSTFDLGPFAGTWVSHSAIMTIAQDGSATFAQRTYRWCGTGVTQHCDTISAQGQIQDGEQEHLQFSRSSGPVAYGTVTASNFHPAGLAVTLMTLPNDTLLYAGNGLIALLCGPNAPVGACGA